MREKMENGCIKANFLSALDYTYVSSTKKVQRVH
jgi:hypothetical protein